MATNIKVAIAADSRYPIDRKRIISVVEKVLTEEGITSVVSVSIAVVGDRKMCQLNKQWHSTDATTDVLSFPYNDPQSSRDQGPFVTPIEEGLVLGDIVISFPMAVKQASQKNKLVDDEIDFLIEHGMLHLLGHHHE